MNLSKYNVVAITGAGLSAESGVPTYRGKEGVYTKIQEELGRPIEEIIHPSTLKYEPDLFWRYWWSITKQVKNCQPNAAHHLLKDISKSAKSYLEITQNVDGFSLICGVDPKKVIELHGSARKYYCMRCGGKYVMEDFEHHGVPNCTTCLKSKRAIIKPKVVLFDECPKGESIKRAMSACARCDVLLIIGTELHFGYLVNMLVAARRNNAIIVHINPEPFVDITHYDFCYDIYSRYGVWNIEKTASEGLKELIDTDRADKLSHILL